MLNSIELSMRRDPRLRATGWPMSIPKEVATGPKKPPYVVLGLGVAALALGLTLALVEGSHPIIVFAALGIGVAFFAAAVLRLWQAMGPPGGAASVTAAPGSGAAKAAAGVKPEAAPTPARPAPARPTAERSAQTRTPAASAPETAAVVVPAAAPAPAPVRPPAASAPERAVVPAAAAPDRPKPPAKAVQPEEINSDLALLLNSTIGDLLQAALLKDPEHVRQLKDLLAKGPAPDGAKAAMPAAAAPTASAGKTDKQAAPSAAFGTGPVGDR
jgi:hypothetical protein